MAIKVLDDGWPRANGAVRPAMIVSIMGLELARVDDRCDCVPNHVDRPRLFGIAESAPFGPWI